MKPLALALLCLMAIACGGPAPMQPASVPVPLAEPATAQATLHPLARAMPADAMAFATMPGTARLSDVVAQVVEGTDLLDRVGREIAAATALSRTDITAFLRDLDGVAVGLTSDRELLVALNASDDAAVEDLLGDQATFEPLGEPRETPGPIHRYRFLGDSPKLADLELHWHRSAKLLLVGKEDPVAAAAKALRSGASLASAPAFTEAARHFAPDPAVNVYVDLPAFAELAAKDLPVDVLSPLVLSLTLGDAVQLRAAATIGGDALPSTASHAPPIPFTLPAALPADTIALLAYSSRVGGPPDRKGRVLLDALSDLDTSAARALTLGAKAFGIDLHAALNALGDEGAIGVVLPPTGKLDDTDTPWNGALMIARQRLRDRDAFSALLARAHQALATSRRVTVAPLDGGFFAKSNEADVGAAIALRDDQLVVTLGQAQGAKALLDARSPTLGDGAIYRRLAPRFEGEQIGLWLDLARGLEALSRNMPAEADELASLTRTSDDRPIGGLSFGWRPDQSGWRVHATMHDVATLGIVSALMIYGVRRYLVASKTAEAKNTVAAITRGAVAAYEREHAGSSRHRLCASAEPVPAIVPPGQRYQPSARPDEDFQRGDPTQGWPCLKFGLTQPHYYRYAYRQGSGYLGPARGGPDPGPNGFEASAEGDLDGDGVTSLFTMTGRVDPKTGELTVDTQVFIDAELE